MLINRKKFIFLFLFIVFLFGNCKNQSPPDWDLCRQHTSSNSSESTLSSSDHLVVYLDTSASMSGYVSEKNKSSFSIAADKETIFSKTLLELRTLVSSLNPQPAISLREVSSEIGSPISDDLSISRAAFTRNLYSGKETNLAGAIDLFTRPLDAAKNPPRFHILITDGVQSSKEQNTGTACDRGSDWRCINIKVKQLLDKGWNGSILGIKSEFQGIVYSEINGQKLPYNSGSSIDKFRPFYLYIFSPDKAEVEKVIDGLKSRLTQLAQENKIEAGKLFREYPLSQNLTENKISAVATTAKEDSGFLQVRQEDESKTEFDILVDTKTESAGEKNFTIKINIPWNKHATDMGNPKDIFNLIQWNLVKIPLEENEKHRYPELKKIGEALLTENQVEIRFSARWQDGIGPRDWRMYHLVGSINPQTMPPWVKSWSTKDDTNTENSSRTLNLESSFANLWDNAAVRKYKIAEVCLRVGDK